MSPADLDAARKAAFDLLDALVRLRNQAKDGALLSPADPLCTERQQRLGELFVRWRRDMAQWWEAEKPLERVAEAVHVLPGRIVHFGLLRERKALTILARLMDDALAHLADDPVLPGTAEAGQAFCEQLEQKLQQPFQGRVGFWEDLGHSLEEDFDLAAQALRELNPLPATGDEGGATAEPSKPTLRPTRRPETMKRRLPRPAWITQRCGLGPTARGTDPPCRIIPPPLSAILPGLLRLRGWRRPPPQPGPLPVPHGGRVAGAARTASEMATT